MTINMAEIYRCIEDAHEDEIRQAIRDGECMRYSFTIFELDVTRAGITAVKSTIQRKWAMMWADGVLLANAPTSRYGTIDTERLLRRTGILEDKKIKKKFHAQNCAEQSTEASE